MALTRIHLEKSPRSFKVGSWEFWVPTGTVTRTASEFRSQREYTTADERRVELPYCIFMQCSGTEGWQRGNIAEAVALTAPATTDYRAGFGVGWWNFYLSFATDAARQAAIAKLLAAGYTEEK